MSFVGIPSGKDQEGYARNLELREDSGMLCLFKI